LLDELAELYRRYGFLLEKRCEGAGVRREKAIATFGTIAPQLLSDGSEQKRLQRTHRAAAAAFGEPQVQSGHPASIERDRALLGDGQPRYLAHIESCTECRVELQTLLEQRRTFVAGEEPERIAWELGPHLPPPGLPADNDLAPPSRLAQVLPALGVLLLAAFFIQRGVVRLLRGPLPSIAAQTEQGSAGQALHLTYAPGKFTELGAFTLDGCKATRVSEGPIDPKGDLAARFHLDGDAKDERVYLVFSKRAFEAAEVEKVLGAVAHGCERLEAPAIDTSEFSARGLVLKR
jgi:hypothetical protein